VLKEALKPNLVQTSEGTPCLIHTGPFANVSIGSSSIIADKIALGLSDYVVTESGFGADCGAEKFFNIKCRYSGLVPDLCVLVCSVRGLKAQSRRFNIVPGEKIDPKIFEENMEALDEGYQNLKKQIENVKVFGVPVIVAINIFPTDQKKEIQYVAGKALEFGALDACSGSSFKDGSKGLLDLARSVIKHTLRNNDGFRYLYKDTDTVKEKIEKVAKNIYGAEDVVYSEDALKSIDFYSRAGFGGLPVCIAKTQFSLSGDESLKGAPRGFSFPVKDVRLAAGAGFILAHSSIMQTMPGLPVEPKGNSVDIDESGEVTGLS
ncbi:MAG TPA: formate--tetrahydrofolate ligase, partial [Candidatus Omnitrophota bacterium]|nr:formate--tetrahydrofolate ligase [Candidatus Omnitrophota bacterium]